MDRAGNGSERRHPDPQCEQYRADFLEVNATGVLVWRSGYVVEGWVPLGCLWNSKIIKGLHGGLVNQCDSKGVKLAVGGARG